VTAPQFSAKTAHRMPRRAVAKHAVAQRRTSAPQKSPDPLPIKLWIRLKLPGIGDIGPGKIELLRKIREHQSISAAAREMNMSYRRAWLLVDDLNAVFRQPVVAKWMGGSSRGGATLTPTGERLVESYDAVVERADSANRALLDELSNMAALPR
jgi:molybdate transport system regulatory protein